MSSHSASSPRILTIGHSNHSAEGFLDLLVLQGIQAIADVRSQPHSRYSPHFNEPDLHESLVSLGVSYVPLGAQLGGRPSDRSLYDEDGHVLYGPLSRTDAFLAGIERLRAGAARYRIAILCSEEDPVDCHRRLLVGRVLLRQGVDVTHVRGDGRLESEEDVQAREATLHPERRQLGMFSSEEAAWRSTRSVLAVTRPRSSSAH